MPLADKFKNSDEMKVSKKSQLFQENEKKGLRVSWTHQQSPHIPKKRKKKIQNKHGNTLQAFQKIKKFFKHNLRAPTLHTFQKKITKKSSSACQHSARSKRNL